MSKNLEVHELSEDSIWYKSGMRYIIYFNGSARYFTDEAIKQLQRNINKKVK